jgi:hypothetical protein
MKRLAGISAVILFSVATMPLASAAIITPAILGPGVLAGPGLSVDFQDVATGPVSTFTRNGITFSNIGAGSQAIVSNTTNTDGAEPAGFLAGNNYLSVLNAGQLQVDFGLTNTIAFYWGSIDPTNSVTFFNGTTNVGSITGASFALQAALNADGNQGSFNSNRFVTLSDADAFNRIVITSGQNSFELDNFIAPPVPEASTWAMMILGFFGIGFMAYRRKAAASSLRFA